MTEQDLAFVADALISLCEADADSPFYTDEHFRRKLQIAEQRDPLFEGFPLPRNDDRLFERECQELYEQANLTSRQDTVLRMRLSGLTFEQIGGARGHTKQGAQSIFLQAIKKIRRAFAVYPYTGLSEVYRREIRRGS